MPPWLELAANRCPERIALEGPERQLTYSQLVAEATAAARILAALGVRDRAALALAPGEDFVVALHACLLLGAAAVPIDLRHSPVERAQRMAGVDAVVSEPLRSLAAGFPAPAGVAPGRPTTPATGPPGPSSAPAVPGAPGAAGTPARVVAVMHTSGSTAEPKPVALTASNFLASALGSAVALGLDPAERWLCPMPLTHVGGLSIPIRSAIYATTAVVHGHFDTEQVLTELMDPARRITLISLVPTMLSRLLDAGLQRPPTLRWVLLGGGPTAPALLARASEAGVPVAPTYGMTEACSQIATFGWPLAGVQVKVHEHEVWVKGAIVSPDALSPDGWLHTGDLGRFDGRGRLEITGRKSEVIISGGENVAPGEVEAVLLEHPAVADAGVHPMADPEWGEAVVAAVVVAAGTTVTARELQEHCAGRLAGFKVPKQVRFVDALPRTVSGKLLRRHLAANV